MECKNCFPRENCAWHQVFAQELSADPVSLKRHQKPPLPFVFSFHTPELPDKRATTTENRLVVIGRAINHLSMLLDGFSGLLSNNPCRIKGEIQQISSRDYQGAFIPLGNNEPTKQFDNLVVLSAASLLDLFAVNISCITLRLLSPLKILKDGKQLNGFEFDQFARSLMRRVSSLAHYYADFEFTCDFKALSEHSSDIICMKDDFTRDTNKKGMGITGQGIFCGDFGELMPFLILGSYFHVGKGAAYGMGCYTINPA